MQVFCDIFLYLLKSIISIKKILQNPSGLELAALNGLPYLALLFVCFLFLLRVGGGVVVDRFLARLIKKTIRDGLCVSWLFYKACTIRMADRRLFTVLFYLKNLIK